MSNLNTDIFRERLADCIREMANQGIIAVSEAETIIDDLSFIIPRTMQIEEKPATLRQIDWHLHGDIEPGQEAECNFLNQRERDDVLSWR